MNRSVQVALLLLAAITPAARGQGVPGLGVYGGEMILRVRSDVPGRSESMTDNVFVGEGAYTHGLFIVEGLYAEGTLTPQGGTPRDLVEARLFAGVRLFQILSVKLGPQIRATSLSSGVRRRTFWELRPRVEAPISDILGAYVEGWTALSGSSNVGEHVDHAKGAEAALTAHLPRWPVWAKLGYRVEQASFDQGFRNERVDGIVLSVGVGWAQR